MTQARALASSSQLKTAAGKAGTSRRARPCGQPIDGQAVNRLPTLAPRRSVFGGPKQSTLLLICFTEAAPRAQKAKALRSDTRVSGYAHIQEGRSLSSVSQRDSPPMRATELFDIPVMSATCRTE